VRGTLNAHFEESYETIRPASSELPLQVRARAAYSRHHPQLSLPVSRVVKR
jgi:hypothetical protein